MNSNIHNNIQTIVFQGHKSEQALKSQTGQRSELYVLSCISHQFHHFFKKTVWPRKEGKKFQIQDDSREAQRDL